MEIYWAAFAVHLLITLYLVWRVGTFYKLILAQLVLNSHLVEFAVATSKQRDDILYDIISLQDQVDKITYEKTPATS
jgi:hypothetical protein